MSKFFFNEPRRAFPGGAFLFVTGPDRGELKAMIQVLEDRFGVYADGPKRDRPSNTFAISVALVRENNPAEIKAWIESMGYTYKGDFRESRVGHIHIGLNESPRTGKEKLAWELAGLLTSGSTQDEVFARLGAHSQAQPLSSFARNYVGRPEVAYNRLLDTGYTMSELRGAVKALSESSARVGYGEDEDGWRMAHLEHGTYRFGPVYHNERDAAREAEAYARRSGFEYVGRVW